MVKTKIAVFISGGGTNLQALIDAQRDGILRNGRITLVISSNSIAYGLKRAKEAGIDAVAVTRRECGSHEAFEDEILEKLVEYGIEYSPVTHTIFLRQRLLRYQSTRGSS